eukprot:TRINITY_DN13_c0_g1_i1.p1 TRINITY_DN13_c0_g1~~TRINITY_DN13_c0_g1_i1.p1  ORF type:complete len:154 (-),score=2.13 TRINITY_DN13_c0_g1_i1:522-983(-)
MSANIPTFSVILLCLLVSTFGTHIVTDTIHVPHQLFDLNENISRRTTVPFTLYARKPVRSRPLIIILPGGLILASDYERLSSAFAYRGFIVAVPQYDQRSPPSKYDSSGHTRSSQFHVQFETSMSCKWAVPICCPYFKVSSVLGRHLAPCSRT